MHSDTTHAAAKAPRWLGSLPIRDLWLLPLVAFGTLIAMVFFSEVGARLYAPANERITCASKDAQLGIGHGRPHCIEAAKIPEGPLVVYAYNACGYRNMAPCGPKPAGTRRIAVMGASFAQGYVVPYEESFGARLEQRLSGLCGHRVEQQNLGSLGNTLLGVYHELDEAIALHPDMILIAVLPYDIENGLPHDQVLHRDNPLPQAVDEPRKPLLAVLSELSKSSRALTMARHFLFNDRDLYAHTYLMSGEKSDFLRTPLSPSWERHLADFDELLGAMTEKTKAAGVPMALLLGPQRAQVVLMTSGHVPPGVDPTALPNLLRQITAKHGVQFIDGAEDFARLQNPEKLIYTVDGHPSGEADAVIAGSLVRHLTRDVSSPFAACKPAASATE